MPLSPAACRVVPQPLTTIAFLPFGDVIEATGDATVINSGAALRYHELARLDAGANGRLVASIFRSKAIRLPFTMRAMENHPLASQAFMPLSGRPYIVAVAPAGILDIAEIKVFLAGPHQGVNFKAGVWHHYNLALAATSDFLVIDRVGPGTNLEEVTFPSAVIIEGGSKK